MMAHGHPSTRESRNERRRGPEQLADHRTPESLALAQSDLHGGPAAGKFGERALDGPRVLGKGGNGEFSSVSEINFADKPWPNLSCVSCGGFQPQLGSLFTI